MAWLNPEWLPLYIAVASLLVSGILAMLQLTFAKRQELNDLARMVDGLERRIEDMPSQRDLHELSIKIADLNGQIQGIAPALKRMERIGDLLLENELKGGDRK
ncbi:DUF2730 family protein [Gallaecimonas mangrovi]|uniref:DUF2730 family protein n=1 Tax=Gallaecimonas mangrovi TaxID=2291597 RepID=UPI000E202F18|nr:DUF2730 family protein [Gallaecimonas mangrovi]